MWLTRYRAVLVDERTRDKSRLEKEIKDAAARRRAVATLRTLSYTVTLEPIENPPRPHSPHHPTTPE